MQTRLSFYDHARQNYGHLEIPHAAEFMLGDYGSEEDRDYGVGHWGEFKIVLHDFSRVSSEKGLSPQVCFFEEATGGLMEFIRLGGLSILTPVRDADQFSRRLIGLGIQDRSETPLPEEVQA
jgi:hypothetical protein